LRKLTPGAVEMVYENFIALVIGFAPGERPSEAVFSIVLCANCVNLFFVQGKGLPDPANVCGAAGIKCDRSGWNRRRLWMNRRS
jgi:hypothetical protein